MPALDRVARTLRALTSPAYVDETATVFRALRREPAGTMLDVGAHYGESFRRFADAGWNVHAFEPDPRNLAHLVPVADEYETVTVVPAAVAETRGALTLYGSSESTGVSSLAPFTSRHVATATVDVISLGDYLSASEISAVDFLKVDVEGYERMVLDGYDWDVPPRVIELEFEDRKTEPLGYTWRDLADELRRRNYLVIVSEWNPIVAYGPGQSWRGWGTLPYELADPNAWGNLLGVRQPHDQARLLRAMRDTGHLYRLKRALGR